VSTNVQQISVKRTQLRLVACAVVAVLVGCAGLAPTKFIDEVGGTTVVDYDTGQPLEGVDIYIVWRGTYSRWDQGSKRVCKETDTDAKTDAYGKFTVGSFSETASTFSWGFSTVIRKITHYRPGYYVVRDDGKVVTMKKDDGKYPGSRYNYLLAVGDYTCSYGRNCNSRELKLRDEIIYFGEKSYIPGTAPVPSGPGLQCTP
jgi:hypothetical protein